MTIEKAIRDYHGSFMLGEADCEHWMIRAHHNEIQFLALLSPEDVGQPDVTDRHAVPWLVDMAEQYTKRDPRFHRAAYYAGFLAAAHKARQREAFAVVAKHAR